MDFKKQNKENIAKRQKKSSPSLQGASFFDGKAHAATRTGDDFDDGLDRQGLVGRDFHKELLEHHRQQSLLFIQGKVLTDAAAE